MLTISAVRRVTSSKFDNIMFRAYRDTENGSVFVGVFFAPVGTRKNNLHKYVTESK